MRFGTWGYVQGIPGDGYPSLPLEQFSKDPQEASRVQQNMREKISECYRDLSEVVELFGMAMQPVQTPLKWQVEESADHFIEVHTVHKHHLSSRDEHKHKGRRALKPLDNFHIADNEKKGEDNKRR